MKKIWYYPQYFPNFHCKASACRHTCCSSWKIPVSRSEYETLIRMECSDELYNRVQRAFEVPPFISEEVYRYICFNWLGECPIQDQGLCSIHREKGEDFLPKICRLYPRSLKQINEYRLASCSCSCEAVVEILLNPGTTAISSGELEGEAELHYEVDQQDIDQITQFQKILKDDSISIADSLRMICTLVNREAFLADWGADDDPLEQTLRILDRLAGSNNRLEEAVLPIVERYRSDPELYNLDRKQFEEDFPQWEGFFNRVMNNSMLYDCFPFVDKRFDKTLSYKGLCACYGLLRVTCIGNHHFRPDKEGLIDVVSALFHLIDHTSFYYNVNALADNAAIMLKL